MSDTVTTIENDIKDILPILEIALPLIIPGAAIPAAVAKVLMAALTGMQAMATSKLDAATVLAQVNATSAAIAANDAKIDAEIEAQFSK